MSSRVRHQPTPPWTTNQKNHSPLLSDQEIEDSARQVVKAMKAQKATIRQSQAAVCTLPSSSEGKLENNASLDNALAVLLPLLEKLPHTGEPLNRVDSPSENHGSDSDSDSGPTTRRSRHAPQRIVLDETWTSDRPYRRMSASRKNMRLWQNILSSSSSSSSASITASASVAATTSPSASASSLSSVLASASPSASASEPSPTPLPASPTQKSRSITASSRALRRGIPRAKRGRPLRRQSLQRSAGYPPSFDLLDKPPTGWKHPLGTYGSMNESRRNSTDSEIIHDTDVMMAKSSRFRHDSASHTDMENSVAESSILESNHDQVQDQVSMDDNVAGLETESRTKRFRTPDSSDSEEDELTASLLAPWRKSGSLNRSRLSNSMSPVTRELSCQLDSTKPQTLTDIFKLSINSDDESISMQSATEDGELGLEAAMETDEIQPASQSEQDVTFSRDMGTIPELQTEDELEEARQRVAALCRSYTIVSENLASVSQLQEEEIVDMDMDEDNPQIAPITEGGKVAEVRTKVGDTHGALETNDQCIIPYVANTANTSPFERVKAIAQKIPPTPSMIVSRKFPSPPVQALQQPWQFPTPSYYSRPTAMPDPGYYVPYAPGYDYHQHYGCGFAEQQEYSDTNSPTNWACVPYRQEQEDANYRLPVGSGRNSHTLTPSTDATVETPEPPFERLSSSESTPGPSSEPSSTASPERCAPPLFVPPLPPGPRPTMFMPPLPPGPRPPLSTPPLPQGPPPPLAAPPTPASPSPSLHPSHNDTATSLNKSLVLTAARIPVSPLTTPEPSSSVGNVKQPADKKMTSASPPARSRQVLMKNKFTLDQSKIKKMAEISKEMLKKQEQLITVHHRVLALP